MSVRLSCLVLLFACSANAQHRVRIGNELLIEQHLSFLASKRVGLVINHTAALPSGELLVDALIAKGIRVTALFGPEHGVRGVAAAGEKVPDGRDAKTGIPVLSLYGTIRKPTAEMLAEVDVLVYDIQDVGARFYTYISTMGLCMEAAAERGIPFIVLDRPNPLGGRTVDGPLLDDSLKSFVGMFRIPVVYGLTCGELATMINEEGWLAKKCNLTVIKMEGWTRDMLWERTGLKWNPPSPNIKSPEAARIYPATCFIEGTNVSEGRGTPMPFQFIGAPFVDGKKFAVRLKKVAGPISVADTAFVPISSKHSGAHCTGVFLHNIDHPVPVSFGLHLIRTLKELHPKEMELKRASLLRLLGSIEAYEYLVGGGDLAALNQSIAPRLEEYRRMASRYFLY